MKFTQALANRSRAISHAYDAFNSMMDAADVKGDFNGEEAIQLASWLKAVSQQAITTLKAQRRKEAKAPH